MFDFQLGRSFCEMSYTFLFSLKVKSIKLLNLEA